MQHAFKIDPNQVRALQPGEAFIINRGRALKARIHRAPQITQPLPKAAPAAPAVPDGKQAAVVVATAATHAPVQPSAPAEPAVTARELPF